MTNTTPSKAASIPQLGPKLYAALKWITIVGIPAFNSLYFGLSQLWGWTNEAQVLGTSALVAIFLGAVLGLSSIGYNASDSKYAGEIHLATDDGGATLKGLVFNADADVLSANKSVTLKVQNVPVGTPPVVPDTSTGGAPTTQPDASTPSDSTSPANPSSASQ